MVHDPMIFWPESSWERRAVSKWEDVRQLALGMLWLSAGLHLSRVVGRGPSSGAAHWWGAVQWGPLRANLLGCALLVLLRTSDRLGLTPHHSLAAAKLRTSGCGALSTSGGLAQLHAAQGSSPRLVAQPRHVLSCYLAFLHLPLDRPTGLPALNASGSEGRLSQQ